MTTIDIDDLRPEQEWAAPWWRRLLGLKWRVRFVSGGILVHTSTMEARDKVWTRQLSEDEPVEVMVTLHDRRHPVRFR